MKNELNKQKLSTKLCKAVLSLSMNSLNETDDDCTFILYEPKQPKQLHQVDLKQLKKSI